jgi:hypothetical protein
MYYTSLDNINGINNIYIYIYIQRLSDDITKSSIKLLSIILCTYRLVIKKFSLCVNFVIIS